MWIVGNVRNRCQDRIKTALTTMRPARSGTAIPRSKMGPSHRRSNRHPPDRFSMAGAMVSRSQSDLHARELATQACRRPRLKLHRPNREKSSNARFVAVNSGRWYLSDTTIYEMEQRGEFPRRFYLTPRCVVWDASEVESWIEGRRRASSAHLIERAPCPDVRKRSSRPVRR